METVNHPSVFGRRGVYESPSDTPAGPDVARRNRGLGIDSISVPELVDLYEAKDVDGIRTATRDFIETVVATERETFGASYQYETQTFLKVLNGLKRHAERAGQAGLSVEYGRCAREISSVAQLMYWSQVFAADGKSMVALGARFDSMSTATMMYPDTFKEIFNLPALKDGEISLGVNIDRVVRACVAVGMCEDRAVLDEFKKRPGWKLLFKDRLEELRYFGQVESWDTRRITTTDKTTGLVTYDSLRKEKESGNRRGIASFGNIWARAETSGEAIKFRENLIDFVGGDSLAVDLGLAIFRIWGLDAEFAAMHIEKDGKKTVLLEGYPNANDLAKLRHFNMWQTKQAAAGHPCGPRKTLGQVKRIFTPFPKFAIIDNGDGAKRTLHEEMWGNANIPAKRLGEADWAGVVPDIQNDWGTRINVPSGGEKGNGLFPWLKAEKSDPEMMASVGFWRLFKLNLNVVVNPQLVSNGELTSFSEKRLGEMVNDEKQRIINLYWEGVRSLSDYKIWSQKSIRDTWGWGWAKDQSLESYIRDMAKEAGVSLP